MANDTSGIMALPAMDQQQEPGPAASSDAQMVFDSMRQNLSSKEISDELLASGAQADPQAVAEFKAELEQLDVPPEILDLINQLVDEVLANPQNYEQIRQKYLAQGVAEDMLPEQFEPEFFAALNIAVDQLRGEPAGPQAFARGGLAELKPIAQAIASYGRNGDTMLAHITPAEARMLKKRGGSGTINPVTGLPEFANIFSKIASAGKKFLRSTAGRMITTIALGALLGPAAAAAMGVGAGTAAGLAISGFVGSAGATLLAGGSARDALKSGATSALLAGAGAALFTDMPLTGEATMTPGEAFQASVDKAKNLVTGAPAQAATPTLPTAPELPAQAAQPTLAGSGTTAPPMSGKIDLASVMQPPTTVEPPSAVTTAGAPAPVGVEAAPASTAPGAVPQIPSVAPPVDYSLIPARDTAAQMVGAPQTATQVADSMRQGFTQAPSYVDRAKDLYTKYLSPSGIEAQGIPAAEKAGREAITSLTSRLPDATPAMKEAAYQAAYKNALPGVVAKYGPMAAAGLGIMGLAGGFRTQPPPESPLSALLTGGPGSANYLLANNPGQYFIQYLPGVAYASGRPRFADGGIVQDGMTPGMLDFAQHSEPVVRMAHGGIADVAAFAEGGKVLSAAQKIELANALVAAQQSDNFTAFNKKISDMGLTQADLLSNFPAINQAGITEAISEGAVVPSASTSNTSSSTTSGSSSSTSSSTSSANDYGRAAEYFRLNPDVRNAYETQVRGKGSNPMTPEQYMDFHYNTLRLTGDAPGTVRQGYVAAPGASGASSPNASASYSGTATGKTLTTAEKFALADVLTKAQQSGNYDPFNAEIQRLGLTQADLLANFPNINQTGIQEHTGRGVVTPMYKGDVATGVRGLTEGQRTQLGNVFLKAQETGNYDEFNKLLSLYQLQPADLVKLYPNLSLEKIQQFQQDQAGKVTFPAPRVDKIFGVGTAAPTQVEVPSATLRTGQRPMDARSESIRQYLGGVGPGAKIESIVSAMDRADISPEQVADVMGMGYAPVQAQYSKAKNAMILGGYDVDPWTGKRTPVAPTGGIAALPAAGQVQPYGGIMSGMMPVTEQQKQFLGQTLDRARESGNFVPLSQATSAMGLTQPDILYNWPGVTPELLGAAAGRGFQVPGGLTAPSVTPMVQRAPVEFSAPFAKVEVPPTNVPPKLMNVGGIAALGAGGYPRRTGQIDGPGTETSDSIPAMLSDGEFVMTARAVRGAGNGDRRAGAKKMYALMHRLEKNAARG